jgi:hypothetical protein
MENGAKRMPPPSTASAVASSAGTPHGIVIGIEPQPARHSGDVT